jgi:precorrin-2 dehydrogenase/sirohydrochlorin ferrochelatase
MGGRRAVVIGAGSVAMRKVQVLLAAGARVVVVAEHIDDRFRALWKGPNPELIKAKYAKDYLVGACIAIAATNKRGLNQQIYKDCQELEVLCNVVDEPDLCDFFVPAVVKRGDLQIAIGTDGRCPAYSGHLRKKLQQNFTEAHGLFVTELENIRKTIIETVTDPADRKALLGLLVADESFEYFAQNGREQWRQYAENIIRQQNAGAGVEPGHGD